jgi:hypothetical protein
MDKLKVLVSKPFWDDALARAIKTFFQTALAVVGAEVFNVVEVDYVGIAQVSAGAAIAAIGTAIVVGLGNKIEESEVVEPDAASGN